MRILHIIPDLQTGGAEMVVLTYLRKMKMTEDILLVSLSSNGHRLYENMIDKEGLPVKYLNQDIQDNSIKGRLAQILQIRQVIKEFNPDVLHMHLAIVWVVSLAIIGLRIPAVFHTLHSDPSKTSYGKNRYIDRFCYRLFNIKKICLNKQMKEISDKIFKCTDSLVLPNGVDLVKYRIDCRNEYRKMLAIKDDEFVLGHIGRFLKVKNHPLIIDTFIELKKNIANSKLILVGDGPDYEKIKCLCKKKGIVDYVLFLGVRSDIPQILHTMDFFIFPSLYEGLGIVLIEAQAAGLPCIISQAIPADAVVTDKVWRMSKDATPTDWANMIVYRNNKPEKHTEKIEIYDTNNVIKKLMTFYHQAIEKKI